MSADATLLLQGSAFDDGGRPLTGGRLKWYAGRRLLGRGEHLTAHDLPSGTTAIRLVATDARGRASQARLALTVVPARPAFLTVKAPTHAARTARTVRIEVASVAPAVLTIAGARHRVDRTPRTITIRVRPGRSTLRLRYSLRGGGQITRGTYEVKR